MTSIHNIKSSTDNNLYNFLNGNRAHHTVPEERGFHTTGNVGSLYNVNPQTLQNVNEGIMFNPGNLTNHSETIIGMLHSPNNNWSTSKNRQPQTPRLYCNEQPLSELLPHYPNGTPNVILNPICNLTLNGVAAPQLAGISTMGVNSANMINNPLNDIGHELHTYGYANKYGTRALGQGRNACEELTPGLNVPPLKLEKNRNRAYISNPGTIHEEIPLYQVGDWSDAEKFPQNFINEFNQNVGFGCYKGPKPPLPPGPLPPGPLPPGPSPHPSPGSQLRS